MTWYAKAAAQGDVNGLMLAGECYEAGRGTLKDEKQALETYQKAADKGHAEAQWHVGRCFAEGIGVAMDGKQAMVWYVKAAMQGHRCAELSRSGVRDRHHRRGEGRGPGGAPRRRVTPELSTMSACATHSAAASLRTRRRHWGAGRRPRALATGLRCIHSACAMRAASA